MQNSYRARLNFNPRSPQGGATIAGGLADLTRELFQSTLPARGSDAEQRERFKGHENNFNPRSPQGGATSQGCAVEPFSKFQSTLPTRGSDPRGAAPPTVGGIVGFQSTLPTRGSDEPSPPWRRRQKNISIHAPHEGERLVCKGRGGSDKSDISIHAPHEGERQPRRP